MNKFSWTPYMFLLPAGVILLVFFFIPLVYSFCMSLYSFEDIYAPHFVGVMNYIEIFKSTLFYQVLLNSLIYTLGVVPPLIIIPLWLAILVNRELRGMTFFKVLFYIPVIVSIVIAGIAWKWLYAWDGLLNYFMEVMQLGKIPWLTSPSCALYSVMAVTVWKGLGYYMVIYLAYLTSVPKELYDASMVDGASAFQKHLYVTIPHLKPAILLISTISIISAMKVFVEIYVMTGGGPLNSSKTIVYQIYHLAFESLELGFASAMGFILMVMILLISLVQIKVTERNPYIA